MLEKITYRNHLGEEMIWGREGVYANYNDLRDYAWIAAGETDTIDSFEKGIVNKTVPLIICAKTEEKGLQIKNRLLEIAEKDVKAFIPGAIIIGEYYLKCYITGSTKTNYLYDKRILLSTLTITTDKAEWIREETTQFRPEAEVESGAFLDFPYDFQYDFAKRLQNTILENTDFVNSEFVMRIYGPVINPLLTIAGHVYQIGTEIREREYIEVNSEEKTIVLTEENGEKRNCYKYRSKDSYIFQKVPPGRSQVAWEGSFSFDITVKETRSEPKWN